MRAPSLARSPLELPIETLQGLSADPDGTRVRILSEIKSNDG